MAVSHPESGGERAVSVTYDPSREDPSMRVCAAVAELRGVDATALPPLSDSLDPDALNALMRAPADTGVALSFSYAGATVTVADGTVRAARD
ncbi:MAG: HalOD1 output domain-containing protein [Halobacteriaceae archaeon]